ncbi:MAG: glutathione S-transferase [Desulfurellaceae bacterium]|nr:glutathione S-transferase [Desulfurellaceae bacterium]
MKLYDCQMAPNPRRVRVFLAEKGVDIPKTEVSIIEGENLKPEYLAVNPRGLLPTLELDDGSRIDETIAICRYIEETQPEPNLMGRDALEKARIESWQRHMEFDGLNPTGEMFRNSFDPFKNRGLPGLENVQAIPELAARGKAGVERFYERLEHRLSQSTYIAGERYTIADITALCVVDFASFAKMGIPEANTNTKRWHADVSSRPSAKA